MARKMDNMKEAMLLVLMLLARNLGIWSVLLEFSLLAQMMALRMVQ